MNVYLGGGETVKKCYDVVSIRYASLPGFFLVMYQIHEETSASRNIQLFLFNN